jgi:hypothetical protein
MGGIKQMVKPRKIGKFTSWQYLTILLVLLVFSLLVVFSSAAFANNRTLQQETPQTVLATPTETPLPEEWVRNARQTDGIALGGTILVLIIFAGTLGVLFRKPARTVSKKFKRN